MRKKSVDRMLREIMIRELVQFKGEYCMYNENYSIIFSSMTGNTRKLADKIHEILPKESCDYFGTEIGRASCRERV